MALVVVENDGHNTPIYHKFRDEVQAAHYVAKRDRTSPMDVLNAWEEQGFYEDNNFVNWSFDSDEPDVEDHTEEA